MPGPPKSPPPTTLPAPWAPYAARPVPARVEALLARGERALAPAADPSLAEERRVEQRVVGLTLETEVRNMAARVGGGLALHREQVAVCLLLLEQSGEGARAARLAWDAGLAAEAARLAEAAGELDVLQAALQAQQAPEAKAHAAALAFHAYESALEQGHLTDALRALREAEARRPDNPSYALLRRTLEERRPAAGHVRLDGVAGSGRVVLAVSPAWLGRGEDVALHLAARGISRRHARVTVEAAGLRVVDARDTVLLAMALPARTRQALALGPVDVEVTAAGGAGWLGLPDGSGMLVVAPGGEAELAVLGLAGTLRLAAWPVDGFPRVALAGAALVVDGRTHRGAVDLAVGAHVALAGREFVVAAAHG